MQHFKLAIILSIYREKIYKMFYSDELIEEVRSKNDIVDVISGYVGLKKSGNSYKCCCPFHNEKTPSFTVSREKQMYHCFGCGTGGNVFTFVMKYENYTFPEAMDLLAKRVGVDLPEKELTAEEKQAVSRRQKFYDINKSAAAYFHYLLTKTDRGRLGYDYFKKRGISDETIQKFGLGYADIYRDDLYKFLLSKGYSAELMRDAGLIKIDEKNGPHDMFWNRVMIPITDLSGKIIAFGGRVLGDGLPKYLNTMETEFFNKRRNLFAMNVARHSKKRGVILCEGYMDVIAQHQAGYDNAVASLGTAFTDGQASLIKRYTDDVYLAYDSDGAGVNATMRAIEILRNHDLSQKIISLSPYKDPDEFIKNEGVERYEERVRQAIPGRLFEIDQISGRYDQNDPEEKTKFMKEAGRILAGITDTAERSNYIDSVAGRYTLNNNELRRIVSDYGMTGNYNSPPPDLRPRSEQGSKTKQNPEEEREKYLLTLMANEPTLFTKLDGIVSEEDFTEKITHEVAVILYKEYREKGTVNPATIVSRYADAELQENVSSVLMKMLEFETTPDEMEKVLTDLIIKIKTSNIEKEQRQGSGISQIELAKRKNQLSKLKISIY